MNKNKLSPNRIPNTNSFLILWFHCFYIIFHSFMLINIFLKNVLYLEITMLIKTLPWKLIYIMTSIQKSFCIHLRSYSVVNLLYACTYWIVFFSIYVCYFILIIFKAHSLWKMIFLPMIAWLIMHADIICLDWMNFLNLT